MNSADLINLKVKHKTFGEGVITNFLGNTLTVQFAEKETRFIYPNVFEKFLVADDAAIQTAIVKEIHDAKQATELQRQAVEEARKAEEGHRTTEREAPLASRKKRNIEDGFDSDYHVKYLAQEPILSYQQVEEQFEIKICGFGRGINRTPSSVVLISSIDKKKGSFVYHDHWTAEGDYIYSGEGKTGNQQISSGNKAIVDAERDGNLIHLFVKFSPQEYYYQGIFSLVDYTYEDEKDEFGVLRKEYKFRLRKLHNE